MSPTVATIIGGCLIVIMASCAAMVFVILRWMGGADGEPTEIGSDYLPTDPLHRRDMQGW